MERYKVVITQTAKADLRVAARYITVDLASPAAQKLVRETRAEIQKLAAMPFRHEIVSDAYAAKLGVRRICIGNYVVLYVVSEETRTVAVVRFGLMRRSWEGLL